MRSMIDVVLNKTKAGGIAVAVAAAITLTGCGGGDSVVGGAGTVVGTVTGQFVDAPVAGLGYKCGASTTLGITDPNGYYTCKTGESVGFYVGDILLGSVASAQAVVTPLDLVGPGAKPTDLAVSNIVRFLLSVSTTDTAGNLVIDTTAGTNAKGKTVDFKTIASSALDAIITTVRPGVTPTTKVAAENHMRDSIYKLFAKNYTGSYGGSLSGIWSLSISATDGSVTGTYTDTVNGAGVISGQMSTDMRISSTYGFTGTAGSAAWTGTLDVGTGVFSGTWDSGTFTGKAGAAPAAPSNPTASGLTPATGAAGASVTITGTNLSAVTKVLFTGPSPGTSFVEGSTTTKTATSIAATVPATLTAGNYTVTLVHSGGEVTVGAFTVLAASSGGTGAATLPTGFVARTNPAGILNTAGAIVWTGTEFVALEQSTDFHNVNAKFFVWKSADGSTWIRNTTDLPSTFISLSAANGKLFQLTANLPASAGATPTVSIAQSSNGINWTSSTANYTMGPTAVPSPMGVKYLNGRYFASLDVDTCMAISSTDAATWISVDLKALTLPTGYYKTSSKFCSEPFYIGGNYLIYGGVITDDFRGGATALYKGLVYRSTDGTNWVIDSFTLPTGANTIAEGGRSSTVVQVGSTVLLSSVAAVTNRRINPTDQYPTQVTDSNQVGTSADGLAFTYADAVGITYRINTVGKPGLTSYFPSINVPGLGVLGMEGTANYWTQDGVNYTAATQGYGLSMTAINYAYSPTLKRLVVIQRDSGLDVKKPTIMTKDF